MSGAGPARFFCLDLAPSDQGAALVRTFLWLKRRIEETLTSGYLVLPDLAFLDGPAREALGWRLTDTLRDEGRLSLGHGRGMFVVTFVSLSGSREPVAAVEPPLGDLQRLAVRSGPVLVATSSVRCNAAWRIATGAGEPPPENYGSSPSQGRDLLSP